MQGTHRTFCAQCVLPQNIFRARPSGRVTRADGHDQRAANRQLQDRPWTRASLFRPTWLGAGLWYTSLRDRPRRSRPEESNFNSQFSNLVRDARRPSSLAPDQCPAVMISYICADKPSFSFSFI